MTNEKITEDLEKRLAKLRKSPEVEYLDFNWNFDTPEVQNLNKSLASANIRDRLVLAKELHDVFFGYDIESAKKIFGNVDPIGCMGRMGTIANKGKQFRIWHTIPGSIERDHVDSCGVGLILHASGTSYKIREYIDSIMPYQDWLTAKTTNGVQIIMYGRY